MRSVFGDGTRLDEWYRRECDAGTHSYVKGRVNEQRCQVDN